MTLTPMSVQPMRWWHIAEVAALEAALFPEDPWSVEQFWQELAQDTRSYLISAAENGENGDNGGDREGAIDGYAGAFILAPDSDIQTIGVRADRQGRGVAGALLSALMAQAGEHGCTHMMLEVRSENFAAIGLYTRHGFTRISERRAYYADGGDALILRARLDRGAES